MLWSERSQLEKNRLLYASASVYMNYEERANLKRCRVVAVPGGGGGTVSGGEEGVLLR